MARTSLFVIPAAGEGTRMISQTPKVLHAIAGLPMLVHVVNACKLAGSDAISIIAGRGAEAVSETAHGIDKTIEIFRQEKRLGTAHAVLAARSAIERGFDDLVIVFGDTPLVESATLMRMRDVLAQGADVVVLGFRTGNPDGYGRLIEKDGKLLLIREHRDASELERKIRFCNSGIMAINGKRALELLDAVSNENARSEYYLTDVVEIANGSGLQVSAIQGQASEVLGINTRVELAQAEDLWQQKRRRQLMESGVTMQDPGSVMLSHDTQIDPDVILEPNIVFGPGVEVKTGATVRAFSHLEGAVVGSGTVVGPYARLRPGTKLARGTKIGNFVEIKNASIQEGAKVNHLSYIGDAEIGSGANIGAGTITCNYDGFNKHRTQIGARAFIGSNSALVAPVNIGDGAYIASGSVIVDDVPDDAMAVARGRQANKSGHAKTIRQRGEEKKNKK